MGNDLELWRCSIGLFHGARALCCRHVKLAFNLPPYLNLILAFLIGLSLNCFKYVLDCVHNHHFLLLLLLLLILHGDVEENPGPVSENNVNSISVLHCNVRSIRRKLEHIRDSYLDFDILCFTETHLDATVSDEFLRLSGDFDIHYRKDRTNHGGGILVYLSSNIVHRRMTELETFCAESIWIYISIKDNEYLIGTFYSPKTSDPDFFVAFNQNVEKALEITSNVIILGDLNEDLLNPNLRKLKDILLINSLHNIITEPTRQTALLDPIITPTDMKILDSGVLPNPPEFSDHHATYITLSFPYNLKPVFERTVYLYKKANFDLLREKVTSFNWDCLLIGTIDDACDLFTNTFLDFVKMCIPSRKVTIRPNDKPWFNNEIRKFCRKRDRLKSLAIKTGKISILNKYKHLRNKVNNMKKNAKQNFFNTLEFNLANLQTNDRRGFWRLVRHFVKNNDSSANIPPLCSVSDSGDTSFFITDVEKAECLNNYFASISSVQDENATLPIFTRKTNNSLHEITIDAQEIEEIILTLNSNKASGPDTISHKMLKGVAKQISKPLSILFNRSLVEGCFPVQWKMAHVIPVYKKGDKSAVSNYRPVSLLSCCGKLFERLVFKHMYNFFHDNNLLYKYQSGFLPRHSTVFQLIDIYHHICQSFDNRQLSCMVFCDISKAFDRVWHKGLLFKLRQNGIEGNLLCWLSNYLSGRQQRVVLQSAVSSLKPISAGVPQGSVLGPLLFLIFVNDISDSLLSLTRLFADDSSLYYSATSLADIEGIINHDLALISAWAKQWLVTFNPSKTEAILFSLKGNNDLPKLSFQSMDVTFVEHHRHLGVTLSSNGLWDAHVDDIIKSASKIISIMRRLKFTLTRKTLNQIYLSYIAPVLEYASIVWDGCSESCSNSLQKLQNEAARLVTGLTRSVSIENLFRECGWQPLKDRREAQKLIFMYKSTHNLVPSYISDLIPPAIGETTDYHLRNIEDIRNLNIRTATSQKSCIPSAISKWNSLDPGIRNSESLSVFKRKISSRNLLSQLPQHYFCGNRFFSVIHARIRNNCSDLHHDLFRNHLRLDPFCPCSTEFEDAEHYMLRCKIYENQRIVLFNSLREFLPINIEILLFGSPNLDLPQNSKIFLAVQDYIKRTGRFSK